MKNFLLFAALVSFVLVYSCQKDSLTDAYTSSSSIAGLRDSLHHPCDSLHQDSLGHHHHHFPHDSIGNPLDSLHTHHWPDSTWTGGGHHPEPDSTGNGGGHPEPDSTGNGGPHGPGGGHGGHHGGHH